MNKSEHRYPIAARAYHLDAARMTARSDRMFGYVEMIPTSGSMFKLPTNPAPGFAETNCTVYRAMARTCQGNSGERRTFVRRSKNRLRLCRGRFPWKRDTQAPVRFPLCFRGRKREKAITIIPHTLLFLSAIQLSAIPPAPCHLQLRTLRTATRGRGKTRLFKNREFFKAERNR